MKINLIGGIIMKTQKIFATLFAVAMLTSGTTTLISNATNVADVVVSEKVSTEQYSVLNDAIQNELITEEEAIQALNELDAVASVANTQYYVDYNHYDSTQEDPSPTQHYLAVFTPQAITNPSTTNFWAYFYIDANIAGSYTTIARYSSLNSAVSYYTGQNISSSLVSGGQVIKVGSRWKVSNNSTIAANSAVFRYKLPTELDSQYVTNEYELHCRTSNYYDEPSLSIPTNLGFTMRKCVYSLGDVDRNGVVNLDDKTMIMSGIVGLLSEDNTNGAFDHIAWKLAADCDQNGNVDILDAITLQNYLNGTEEL